MECENSVLERLERGELLDAEELLDLLHRVKRIFAAEPNVIHIKGPVTVSSGVQGQFFELLEIFKIGGALPEHQYLFLGDNVNRGYHSTESITYLFALKDMYPHRITLLLGLHETLDYILECGLYEELRRKYTTHQGALIEAFRDVFTYLPLCAIVENKAFCVRSGLSPTIKTIEDILAIDRKQVEQRDEGQPVYDLLHSDPIEEYDDWSVMKRNGYSFGKQVVAEFLQTNGLELIVQRTVELEGAAFMFDGMLLKLFSPTNYMYRVENRGAVVLLYLDNDGKLQKKFSFVPQSPKTLEFLNDLKRKENESKTSFDPNKN